MLSRLNRVFVTAALVVAVVSVIVASTQRNVTNDGLRLGESKEFAFRQGGFRAAAAVTGTYERTQRAESHLGPMTLDDLVDSAEVIVVGHVASNRSVLPRSGDVIRTHYRVDVRRVLKGDVLIEHQDRVVLSVLGGRVAVGNGNWAQLNIPYSRLPANGNDYVLFMNRVPLDAITRELALDTEDAEFWPAQSFAGIVGLSGDGTHLLPADHRKGAGKPLSQHLNEPTKFVDEVARLSRLPSHVHVK